MTQNTRGISGYEAFAQMRGELLDMVDALGRSTGELDQVTLDAAVTELRDRISRDSFSVIIMGEFNSGKTTTVNALLGEKVLPVSGKPTTAVLTVVKWGQDRRATLYPLEPGDRPEEGTVIDPDALLDHITVDAGATAPRTWGRAEVEWPLDLCRNNVEIIDSPGLNEDEVRSRITLEHTSSADAVVFVVSALQALSQSEREVIDHNLRMFEHDNLYLLVNRINQVEDDVEEVRADLLARAKEYWGLDEDRVLFIDARSALRGRSAGDPDRVAASGLIEFERSLERFLTEQRSRIKIVVPASEIGDLAAVARENIDDLHVLMDKDLAELTEEYERQQGPLDRLWEERNDINRVMGNHMEETRQRVSVSAEGMLLSAADSCVSWSQEVAHQNRVDLALWRSGRNAEALTEEIVQALSDRILKHADTWRRGELTALLNERATELQDQVGERFTAFAEDLDKIRAALLNAGTDGREHLPSTFSRTASAGAGLLFNPGTALIGSQFGFKAMLKELVPQLAVMVALAFLGFGPGVIFTAAAGVGAMRTFAQMNKLNEKIVRTAAEQVAKELSSKALGLADTLAGDVHRQLDAHRQRVDRGLADSINAVRDQVRFALNRREEAQQTAEERRLTLAAHRRTLDEVRRRSAQVVRDWALVR